MHYYNGARTHLPEERCANPTSRSGHRTHSADTNSWRVTPSICSDLISDRDSRPIDRSSHNSSWLFGRLLRRKNHTKAGCLHDRRALDAGADSRAVKPRWRHDKQAHQFPAADRAKFRQAVSDRNQLCGTQRNNFKSVILRDRCPTVFHRSRRSLPILPTQTHSALRVSCSGSASADWSRISARCSAAPRNGRPGLSATNSTMPAQLGIAPVTSP